VPRSESLFGGVEFLGLHSSGVAGREGEKDKGLER